MVGEVSGDKIFKGERGHNDHIDSDVHFLAFGSKNPVQLIGERVANALYILVRGVLVRRRQLLWG